MAEKQRYDIWTYASANSVTVPGDMTGTYWPGMRVALKQGTLKYFMVDKVEYSSPTTTITLNGFGIYTLTNAAITAHIDTLETYPKGFPEAVATSEIAGFCPTLENNTSKFLRSDGSWDVPAGTGDVTGPSSAVDNNFATFNSTSGKLIKDSGKKAADFATSGHTHTGMGDVVGPAGATNNNFPLFDGATGKLVKDSIYAPSSFAAASHGHVAADVTAPTPSGKFLKDNGTWDTPAGGSGVVTFVTVGRDPSCDFVTDGTDDYEQIQDALDYLASTGGIGKLIMMADEFNLGASAPTITVPEWITIEGVTGNSYSTQNTMNSTRDIPVIKITNTSVYAFSARSYATFRYLQFYYPNQVTNATPTVYPATIGLDVTNGRVGQITIEYCHCSNAYILFDDEANSSLVGNQGGSHTLRYNIGYPLKTFAKIHYCYDTAFIENNRINPCHASNDNTHPGTTLLTWVQNNGIVFDLDHFDGGRIHNNLIFSHGIGIKTGVAAWIAIIGNHFEACKYPMYIDGANHLYILGNVMWVFNYPGNAELTTGYDIYITNSSSYIQIIGNQLLGGSWGVYNNGCEAIHVKDNYLENDKSNSGGCVYSSGVRGIITGNKMNANNNGCITLPATGDESIIANNHLTCIGNAITTAPGCNDCTIKDNVILYGSISIGGTGICDDNWKVGTGEIGSTSGTWAHGTSTGTGSEQTIAHGLGAMPHNLSVVLSSVGKSAYARADATNVYITVSSGEAYRWSAGRFA